MVRVKYDIEETEEIRYLETTRSMSNTERLCRGHPKCQRSEAGGHLHQRDCRGNRGGEDCGVDVSSLGRRECDQRTAAQALINYTPGYVIEDLDEQPLVTNPEVTELKKQRAGLVSELNRLKIELAEHVLKQPGDKRKTPPRSQAEILESIAVAESAILLTDQKLDPLPAKVNFADAHDGEKLRRFDHEKKRFLDCIKVFVYNLKIQLCHMLLSHYDWQKELLPALAMIVERAGYVKLEGGRLRVTLRRFKDHEID